MQALIETANLAAAELAKYDGAAPTGGFETLNIATAVAELADLESYATWRSTEFGAAQTTTATAKAAYEATEGALTMANDALARLYQSRGRDAIDKVITFENGTNGSTFRTVVGGEFPNDQTTGYALAANGRVPYATATKDVTWIEVGKATFKADQSTAYARFAGTGADEISTAQTTTAKALLTGEVDIKSVNVADKTCVVTSSATDYMLPMEAFDQTDDQIAAENARWPRTTKIADALSIRSKHWYATGIAKASLCLSCFYVAGASVTDDWVWSPSCNLDVDLGNTNGGETACNALGWKSDYTLQTEVDNAVATSD